MNETTRDCRPADRDCERSYRDGSRARDRKPCGRYFDNH